MPQATASGGWDLMDVQVTVDARGTRCPVPINRLSTAAQTTSGTVIELLADDPNARVDVPVWCRLKRHELIEVTQTGGAWRFLLRAG
jgi:tRNA 2-thiouridine synthesizing protein A